MKKTGIAGKMIAIIFWLCIWQFVSVCVHNQILLVGPVEVLLRMGHDIGDFSFWQTIFVSAKRIITGFLSAFVLGSLFGMIANRYRWVRELLKPFMSAVVSVPVASFAVILLIWFGAANLSIWIAFLITFPNLYYQTMEGMNSADGKLLEVAKVYRMSAWNQAWYLYRPALAPFLKGGCKVSVGLAWKSGVAAEVIGLPAFSIGEQIYMSKIYLDTAGVLSWTIVCVCMSIVAEKVLMRLLDVLLCIKVPMAEHERKSADSGKYSETSAESLLIIEDMNKRYENHIVLNHVNGIFQTRNAYAFMEPSGSGKTTLFRILSQLEDADSGYIHMVHKAENERKDLNFGNTEKLQLPVCGMTFQENRLFQTLTAEENLNLVLGRREGGWNQILAELLPEDELHKSVSQFSGGMARRVEVIRCLFSTGDVLLLDEPFNGLDEAVKVKTAALIKHYQGNRILMIATHSLEEAALLGAQKASLL